MYEENLEELKQKTGSKVFKHYINVNSPILPFRVNRIDQTQFNNGFDSIIGDFSRILFDKKLPNKFNIDYIFQNVFLNNDFSDFNNTEYLKLIIQDYLEKDDSKINILHPYLFLYINKTPHKRADNEQEIAAFFRDVFFKDINDFKNIYDVYPDNIIVKLIMASIPELPGEKTDSKYISKLNFIVDVFKEDIEFILDKPNFIINNLSDIFAFYYFYYCSQMVLKLNQSLNEINLNKPTHIYYLLDWEKASKSRKAISNGYGIINNVRKTTYTKMIIIEHINTLIGTNGLFPSQILDLIEDGIIDNSEFIHCMNDWTKYYCEKQNLNYYVYSKNFEDLLNILNKSISESLVLQQKNSYAMNLTNVALKYFIKRRGKYGHVLNLTKDFLYLITSLCIKEDKIKLNDLFKEYERRGLFFDRYSKEEIINLLNIWNLIDKKSDSGDAQYVKSIL